MPTADSNTSSTWPKISLPGVVAAAVVLAVLIAGYNYYQTVVGEDAIVSYDPDTVKLVMLSNDGMSGSREIVSQSRVSKNTLERCGVCPHLLPSYWVCASTELVCHFGGRLITAEERACINSHAALENLAPWGRMRLE